MANADKSGCIRASRQQECHVESIDPRRATVNAVGPCRFGLQARNDEQTVASLRVGGERNGTRGRVVDCVHCVENQVVLIDALRIKRIALVGGDHSLAVKADQGHVLKYGARRQIGCRADCKTEESLADPAAVLGGQETDQHFRWKACFRIDRLEGR